MTGETINPQTFRWMAIKTALEMYLKTGMMVNSNYTLKNMLAMVTNATGKKYTRKTAPDAINDIEDILRNFHLVGE